MNVESVHCRLCFLEPVFWGLQGLHGCGRKRTEDFSSPGGISPCSDSCGLSDAVETGLEVVLWWARYPHSSRHCFRVGVFLLFVFCCCFRFFVRLVFGFLLLFVCWFFFLWWVFFQYNSRLHGTLPLIFQFKEKIPTNSHKSPQLLLEVPGKDVLPALLKCLVYTCS